MKKHTPIRWRPVVRALATLRRDVNGKFSRWKAGETVKATQTDREHFLIERVKWTGKLPLMNQLYGVPKDAVAIKAKCSN
jgi:hypothetical protein